jgi:hypothetical protein
VSREDPNWQLIIHKTRSLKRGAGNLAPDASNPTPEAWHLEPDTCSFLTTFLFNNIPALPG